MSRRAQQGVTLLEALVVVIVLMVLVIGGVSFYRSQSPAIDGVEMNKPESAESRTRTRYNGDVKDHRSATDDSAVGEMRQARDSTPAKLAKVAPNDSPYAVAVRTECPADVNREMPVSVFEDKMLIRLPKGVQTIVEDTPFSGYINPRPAESTKCVDGVAGATIINGETGFFKDDPRRPMGKVLNDVLFSTISFPETSKVDLGTEKGSGAKRTVTAEVTVPAAENKAESKAFVMLKSAHGRMHYLVYECETPAWNALKATFKESAKSMLLLNPDG